MLRIYILFLFTLGFACFCFFVSFAIFVGAAFYISPVVSGSNAEKSMARNNPHELQENGKYYKLPQ